ncbi:hypothetical protein D3C81_441880 [compost metagenome]
MSHKLDWLTAPITAEAYSPATNETFASWYRRDSGGQVHQQLEDDRVPGRNGSWVWMGGRTDFPPGAILRPSTEAEVQDNGGPAEETQRVGEISKTTSGLTVLDQMALEILKNIIQPIPGHIAIDSERFAKLAYQQARAMMKERGR